jgi:hypothetical protein
MSKCFLSQDTPLGGSLHVAHCLSHSDDHYIMYADKRCYICNALSYSAAWHCPNHIAVRQYFSMNATDKINNYSCCSFMISGRGGPNVSTPIWLSEWWKGVIYWLNSCHCSEDWCSSILHPSGVENKALVLVNRDLVADVLCTNRWWDVQSRYLSVCMDFL